MKNGQPLPALAFLFSRFLLFVTGRIGVRVFRVGWVIGGGNPIFTIVGGMGDWGGFVSFVI